LYCRLAPAVNRLPEIAMWQIAAVLQLQLPIGLTVNLKRMCAAEP